MNPTSRDKAKGHKVQATETGYVVTSGSSGKTYMVTPLTTGGASCSCEHGRAKSGFFVTEPGFKPEPVAVRCSHVLAVEAEVARG